MSIIISKEFLLAFLLHTLSAVILETTKRIKNKTESKQKKITNCQAKNERRNNIHDNNNLLLKILFFPIPEKAFKRDLNQQQ